MDFTVIANAVEVNDGVVRVSMRFIKKYAAPGQGRRLSAELCEKITTALGEQGLITVPRRLPTSENDFVFVIKKESPLGEAVAIATIVTQMDKGGVSAFPGFHNTFPEAAANFL